MDGGPPKLSPEHMRIKPWDSWLRGEKGFEEEGGKGTVIEHM